MCLVAGALYIKVRLDPTKPDFTHYATFSADYCSEGEAGNYFKKQNIKYLMNKFSKIFIAGHNGMVGKAIVNLLKKKNLEI